MPEDPTTLWIGYGDGRPKMPKLDMAGYCPKTGLPIPRDDELQHHWLNRFLSNHVAMQQFPGSRARANHALRRWKEHEAVKLAKSQQTQPVQNARPLPPSDPHNRAVQNA